MLYAQINREGKVVEFNTYYRQSGRNQVLELRAPRRGVAYFGTRVKSSPVLALIPELLVTRACDEIICATSPMKDVAFPPSTVRVRQRAFEQVRYLKHA